MYKIKPYSYNKAKKLNLYIQPSTLLNFKIDIFDKNKKYITSIGDKNYSDYPSYVESHGLEYADKRKKLYHLRHKNDNGEKGFYASYILW